MDFDGYNENIGGFFDVNVLLITTGGTALTLGAYNPLRYRGYVYDTETGFYYLQSRYYDPELSRFINADALVSTGQGLLGNNMFAYCRNNPVNRKDTSGTYDVCNMDNEENGSIFDDYGNTKGTGGAKTGGSYTGGSGVGSRGNVSKTSPYTGGSYSAGQYYPNTPSTNPQYTPPSSGGGVTSSTMGGSVQVDFDHGGRHIDNSKINFLIFKR